MLEIHCTTRMLHRRAPSAYLRAASACALMAFVACVPNPSTYQAASLQAGMRIALLPLANYTQNREAPDKIVPILLSELGNRGGVHLADPGAVEAVLTQEPWLLFDRIPPDLVDHFGNELGVDALLVGAVLGYGYRQSGGERVPHVSISLRLVRAPGGIVLWSAVHSRDGDDNESVFGFGRIHSLEQLLMHTVAEIAKTFPPMHSAPPAAEGRESGKRASLQENPDHGAQDVGAIAKSAEREHIPVGADAAAFCCAVWEWKTTAWIKPHTHRRSRTGGTAWDPSLS